MDQTFEKRKKVIYDFICDDFYVPMKIKEIAMVLQITKEQRKELQEVLDSLVEEGKISLSKRGKYSKGQTKRIMGTFQANIRGFGFVMVEGQEEDIFIPAENVNGAFQGDEVECIITGSPSGRRQEGKIVGIISHQVTKVVGLYEKSKSFGFVRPDNQRFLKDIYIPAGKELHAMTGHKVVVELTSYGGEHMKPEGKIIEILGHVNDPGTDILSIVKDFDIPTEFPEKVLNQAVRVGKEVSEADMAGRMDLRDWQMVTIDGEDAKDLDDAVSVVMDGENYRLGVHIADVTNYVQERSALDWEALKRGTSVYLADRVIPMLPQTLSNGICSLNAGEDRLALSCIMTIDVKGNVVDHQIAETVVNVDERMSYTSVKKILEDRDEAECERYHDLIPMFELMKELSHILRERRHRRGAIDFDFPECKLILDDEGHPIDIVPYDRNFATKIIEEFMLAANKVVAEDSFWKELPFLYRTHEYPDLEKIRELAALAHSFSHILKVGQQEVHPREIQKLMESIEGTEEETFLSRLTLRAMKRAKYEPENEGHFGLATKYYCHFTSPIRRYPDLQIHRILKESFKKGLSPKRQEHYQEILSGVAKSCSSLERRADDAEREVDKMKKTEFMQSKIGECYEGVISGVTSWGIYVELPNTIEGMIRLADLTDDVYEYDAANYRVVGTYSAKEYRLGQKMRVQVVRADKNLRTIDFLPENMEKREEDE